MAFASDKIQQRNPAEIERENALSVQDNSKNITISVKIQQVRHFTKETGFFVASATFAPGKIAPRVIVNGKMMFSKDFVINGISPTFGDHDRIGQIIDCTGQWIEDSKYGIQFKTLFINEQLPISPEALKKYLSDGRIKFIGKAIAEHIIEKWGMESFEILKSKPNELTTIPGITKEKAEHICKQWNEKQEVYEIVSYLGMHGVGEGQAMKVFDFYKSANKNAIDSIKMNPYSLTNIEGIGFKTADQLALSLGFDFDNPIRLRSALYYELEEKIKKDGDTAMPVDKWVNEAVADLGIDKKEVLRVCQELITNKEVIIRKLEVTTFENAGYGKPGIPKTQIMQCVSPKKEALTERSIALELQRIIESQPAFDMSNVDIIKKEIYDPKRNLDISQIKAAWNALTNPISIITGGPGTGKTTTLKTIVSTAEKMGLTVILSAPTGKAAKRMEESIQRTSMTIHRRLGFKPGGAGFNYDKKNPLSGDMFVIDETSMVDSQLFLAFLSAIPNGAMLLFVGDADQLPSVGAGDVLRDLIKSGHILVSRLQRIHRTDALSQIPINAKLINEGKTPSLQGDVWKDSYAFVTASDNQEIVNKTLEIVSGLLKAGYNTDDIQVLTPQRNGETGVENLNLMLKPILNNHPFKEKVYDAPVSLGDRLMQTKNDYDLEIYNGDMGYVEKIDEVNEVFVFKTEDNVLSIPFKKAKDLVPGYAITVHKSQGSEKPVIILPLSRAHLFTLNKNLIYTGVTRGKNKVIIISDGRTITQAVAKISQLCRITGLREQIKILCSKENQKLIELPPNPYGVEEEDSGF